MRILPAVLLLLLCFALPAAAERATLMPMPEAKKYLVPAAQLMRVDEGVFDVPVGGTIDLTDRKILLSVTSFTSGREKKCCTIMLNGDRITWRTVGHRFDLKQLSATRQSLYDKNQCFLDIVDVATPKGAPWLLTFRLHCP
jgi:hypothetical protein